MTINTTSLWVLIPLLFFVSSSAAGNKVVVIPLSGSEEMVSFGGSVETDTPAATNFTIDTTTVKDLSTNWFGNANGQARRWNGSQQFSIA